jgi:membrane fusion protein (multidrug efflux system)
MAKQWLIATTIIVLAAVGVGADVYLDDGADTGQAREKRVSNVNVVQPKADLVRDVVVAVGTLRSRQQIELTSEVSGRIVELNFDPGDPVAEGQLLVRLNDRQAQADLRVSNAQYADAKRQYDRAQSLRSNNSISQAQVDELLTAVDVAEAQRQAAQVRLENHRIEAPFAGVVGLSDISIGAYVTAGTTVTTLDNTERMELNFAIPERFLGQVGLGQQVRGTSPAFPDTRFSGELAELGTRINELSRTSRSRAD